MKLLRMAEAGTEKSSDIHIRVEPREEGGIAIQLESIVLRQFGRQIEETIRNTLQKLGIKHVNLTARDNGALDYAICARVETAIRRAGRS